MKTRAVLCAALLVIAAGPLVAHAGDEAKSAKKATTAAQAMDPAAMEAMMKLSMPGPHHEMFKRFEGQWNQTVKWTMDPSQPAQESKAVAVVKTIMDGRYLEEETSGTMMEKPFVGMGFTGYDNVIKKYVSVWMDNAGTGIMTSEGVADATGNIVNWTGRSSDPMTGKTTTYRMVSHVIDDNSHTFEMYTKGPAGKEFKTMEILYERKL